MASLIIQTDDRIEAGVITGRVLIGRKPFNTIPLDHTGVSRIHAWIERRDGQYWIGDCGGRNGTYVNGERIDRRRALDDGDEIHIARTTLLYRDSNDLPPDVQPIVLEQADAKVLADRRGFLFDCACGAPTWVPNFLAGYERSCGHCGQIIHIPGLPKPSARSAPPPSPTAPPSPSNLTVPVAAPQPPQPPRPATTKPLRPAPSGAASSSPPQPAPRIICSICQCPVTADEEQIACPDCALVFHIECWEENLGCSAYGCAQVNALAPTVAHADNAGSGITPKPADCDAVPVAPSPAASGAAATAAAPADVPWDYVLLGGSVVASALGVLAFGLPALLVLMAGCFYLGRSLEKRHAVTILAVCLALVGLATGLFTSYLWWLR